jgi:hypothetical protein
MFRRPWIASAILLTAAFCAPALASHRHQDVTVEIVGAHGASFQQFPVERAKDAYRAYVRAEKGARYRIRVRNQTGERLGLVIAVDGRNIVSGKRSDLGRNEPKYILGPWQMEDYSGWRTSLSEVHEFFFTEWESSYAEAFGDRSARGVIAVAVFRENLPPPPQALSERESKLARSAAPVQAPASAGAADEARREPSEPGTGFGDRREDAAVRVTFEAARHPSSRLFLKYEWPNSLCRRGLLRCDDDGNRFWDDELAFAPYPPRQ